MNCGGMYAVKIASKFLKLIEVTYIGAPVMSLLSFPCDLGISKGGFLEEPVSELLSYCDNSIDVMHVLLEKNVPT